MDNCKQPAAKRDSLGQVSVEVSTLSDAIGKLEDVADTLPDKLDIILSGPLPTGETSGKEPCPQRVELAAMLAGFSARVTKATDLLNDIVSRCEL